MQTWLIYHTFDVNKLAHDWLGLVGSGGGGGGGGVLALAITLLLGTCLGSAKRNLSFVN